MRVAIRVRVLLFARLRELAGADSLEVGLEPGATVSDVFSAAAARHERLAEVRDRIRPALNAEFVEWDRAVAGGDEVAFIPPVSGGALTAGNLALLEITREPLDSRRLEAAVARSGAGGICTFTGVVRDSSEGRETRHLEYEAYEQMAAREIERICAEVAERWPEARLAIAHRLGRLEIGEASVVISASAPHRAEAFAACRHAIDRLKESVPIWKKEFFADGSVWKEGGDSVSA